MPLLLDLLLDLLELLLELLLLDFLGVWLRLLFLALALVLGLLRRAAVASGRDSVSVRSARSAVRKRRMRCICDVVYIMMRGDTS